MVTPIYGLVFFLCYEAIIWFYNLSFIRSLKYMEAGKKKQVKWLALSNIFLASGDLGLFLGLVISYLQKATSCDFSFFYLTFLSSTPGTQFLTLSGGIFATSITMSFYYLFLALYVRDRFGSGKNNTVMFTIYVLFAARILLLFNPDNIWLASCLPEHTPNYSAWLRNGPFFVYGLLAVFLLGRNALAAAAGKQTAAVPVPSKHLLLIVVLLIFSFLFYGLDIFFSHKLPQMAIWMTYILKTIAYIVVAIMMWRAEFKIPRYEKG